MAVRVTCPNPDCGAAANVEEQSLGKRGRCKKCGHVFALARPDGEAASRVSNDASAWKGQAPAGPADLPEQFGRYRIMKPLGRGGMGAVYLAHDTKLDRPVALKVPFFHPLDGPLAIQRFEREARAAATLDHPNLCPIYDVGEVDGVSYLTMPYIKGKTLDEAFAKNQTFTEAQAAAVVRKLALALQEAHDRGIIHRDLKPGNIMINRRRELIIMDFGLARVLGGDEALTRTGHVLGTALYMAPEQAAGDVDTIGPAADIYSLGVILHELLTGRRPFEGPWSLVVGLKTIKDPDPPSKHRPDIGPVMNSICLKAIAQKPEDRYATMAEFAEALGDFLNHPKPNLPPEATEINAGQVFAVLVRHEVSTIDRNKATVMVKLNSIAERWRQLPNKINLLFIYIVVLVFGTIAIYSALNWKLVARKVAVEKISVNPNIVQDTKRAGIPPAIQFDSSGSAQVDKKVEAISLTTPPFEHHSEVKLASLFNGKDLTGWTSQEGVPSMCEVLDGIIVTTGKGRLYTLQDDFRDFYLRAELKAGLNFDGKLFFRSDIRGNTENTYGVAINCTRPKIGTKSGSLLLQKHDSGEILAVVEAHEELVRPEEWFVLEIIAIGNHFTATINEKQVSNWIDQDYTYRIGRLGIQRKTRSGDGFLSCRRIEVRRLPIDSEMQKKLDTFEGKPPTGDLTLSNQFSQVFSEGILHGKLRHYPSDADVTRWTVENELLIGSGKGSKFFLLERQYRNFDLRAEILFVDEDSKGVILFRSEDRGDRTKGYSLGLGGNLETQNKINNRTSRAGAFFKWAFRSVNIESLEEGNINPPPINTWFPVELRVVGDRFVARINNGPVIEATDPAGSYGAGFIGFLSNGGKTGSTVRIKHLEIKSKE